METKIKRLAQFLFDNADMIAKELSKSSHYRTIGIQLDMFKSGGGKFDLSLYFYDEKIGHSYLKNDAICIERFRTLCEQINNESGFIPPSKPVKVRKTL